MTLTLIPCKGSLAARVFSNPHIGLKPTLFFDIEIPVEPFEYDGELQQTSVRLEFIDIGLIGGRQLAGQSFDFPKNPDAGYIDGSIYLGNAHNPVGVGRIRFGRADGRLLAATVEMVFDFEYEGPQELGVVATTWDVVLEFDSAQIDTAASEARALNGASS